METNIRLFSSPQFGQGEEVNFYASQADASRALGCSHKTVWGCLKTGRRFQGKYLIQRTK